jgi:hypothetical protein
VHKIVLAIPKRKGRRTRWIKAEISDRWITSPVCKDFETTALLVSVRPEWRYGYLPAPVRQWAEAAEAILGARVVSIEEPSGEIPPGVVMGSL